MPHLMSGVSREGGRIFDRLVSCKAGIEVVIAADLLLIPTPTEVHDPPFVMGAEVHQPFSGLELDAEIDEGLQPLLDLCAELLHARVELGQSRRSRSDHGPPG